MATVSFDTGSVSITIPVPSHPEAIGKDAPVAVGRTISGGFKVADLSGSTDPLTFALSFLNYPTADTDTLVNWLINEAQRGAVLFTYTDEKGTDHTNMRYISGLDRIQSAGHEVWNFTITIGKDTNA